MSVDDVLALLTKHPPPPPASELPDRIAAALVADAAPVANADWLTRQGDDAFALLLALLGQETLAAEALEEVALRVLRDEPPEVALRTVALETLALQAKAGHAPRPLLGELTPEAQWLLLSRAGDLTGAISELTHAVEARLAGDCRAEAARLAAAAVAQPAPERTRSHPAGCEACELLAARLDDALEVSFARAPDLAATSQRAAERRERERDHQERVAQLQVRVSVCCSFCHGGLVRDEAVFCASCLAPHHEDCFRDHGRCSAIGCEETETVQARAAEPRPRSSSAARRLARRLPWIGLGGLVTAAAFGAYMVEKDRRVFEAWVAQQQPLPMQAPTPTPRAQPTDQVEVLLWEQIRTAKAKRDYATWHRLGVELWHRRPKSAYSARLELPLLLLGAADGWTVSVNGVTQGLTEAGKHQVALYRPTSLVEVVARKGGQRWRHVALGTVYHPPNTIRAGSVSSLPEDVLLVRGSRLRGQLTVIDLALQRLKLVGLEVPLSAAALEKPALLHRLEDLKPGDTVWLTFEAGEVVKVEPE